MRKVVTQGKSNRLKVGERGKLMLSQLCAF